MQALKNATRGAQRAAILTERLLAFSRRKPLEPRVIDINAVISGLSDLLQRTLGERIKVRTTLHPHAWNVETDPTELETAILNLAVNARDAMPAGGELVIETANAELDSAAADANPDVKTGSYVVVSVTDTGMGMTADVLSRVFEPFFTTKPDGRGTGLGLSQVYGFMKQTGGHIQLSSEPARGTTARLYFPRAPETAGMHQPVEGAKTADQIPQARNHESILVVEDDDDVRDYTVGSLRELGYTVFEAVDAPSALQIVERESGIHLLFTDLGLPGAMDGKALAERARATRPLLKVLITTAYAGGSLMHEGRLDAGIDLLAKPFTFAALASRIRELLDRPRPLSFGARVLVVDDEALLRMLIVDSLSERGLSVEQAGSFQEALSKVCDMGNALAAAIIDLGLPDRPGDELVTKIRALRPNLPVILATGYADEDTRRRFANDELLRIVTKPFDPADLATILAGFGIASTDRARPILSEGRRLVPAIATRPQDS
jgi:CheY-like chemotaxis protein